jgi:hypothetical protein
MLTRAYGRKGAARSVRTTRAEVRPDSKRGATTIVLRLARPTIVRFTVMRVHPTCERVGAFRVRARGGVNSIKWRGRLRGKPLAEGTYRLLVRVRGRDAAAVKLVVVRGKPLSVRELRRARNANVCGAAAYAVVDDRVNTALGGEASSPPSTKSGGTRVSAGESLLVGGAGTIGRGAKALGARFTRAVDDPESVHLIVWAALALSILLLSIAAVPSETLASARAGAIAYRRFEVALAGSAALGAALLLVLIR